MTHATWCVVSVKAAGASVHRWAVLHELCLVVCFVFSRNVEPRLMEQQPPFDEVVTRCQRVYCLGWKTRERGERLLVALWVSLGTEPPQQYGEHPEPDQT